MSLFYRLAYRLGITPWEEASEHAVTAAAIRGMFDREEEEREPPYGRALDLGCGSGYWAVELARRGWDVVGVDIVPKALERARERAREAGVDVELIEGDLTALRAAGVGSGFDLFWDFGAIHGLDAGQREAVGREMGAVAAPGATALVLAWKPGRRGPLPRGASRTEIEAAFAGWQIVDEQPFDATRLPRPLRGVEPRVYRLRRGT